MKSATFVVFALTILSGLAIGQPIGDKPNYLWGGASSVPNQDAIGAQIWAPGLEDGYVPQGLTTMASTVLVGSYKSVDPKVGSGPCRIFAVSMATGKQTGYFDMPEDCGHAGGLTMIDPTTVVVSDTRMLYKIDLARALEAKQATPAMLAVVKLGGLVKGSFVQIKHDVVIGIEDLSFDPEGGLWAVSEAGSRRWSKWSQTFPLVFRMDVSKLK